jgi:hypothetical protein
MKGDDHSEAYYWSVCLDCDGFAVALAHYTTGKPGEWIRCSCGKIHWAKNYHFPKDPIETTHKSDA